MPEQHTSREDSFAKWYQDIVIRADLAEHSDVRGCMVIKPYGFSIWERLRDVFDRRFKDTGHSNAYFPLFIPKHYFAKEAEHVEGFAKECAVVTHHRLRDSEDGGVEVDPDAKLDEELVVRPTSETTIWNTYRDWIQSYRDLPLLINQWANVVRWEMRTRLFLRTSEFLWQEGHTAHATAEDAMEETRRMLDIYAEVVENTMAIPVIKGTKTESERFAGAEETFCIEMLMQDGKALQGGTSHFLGQNFAKAFDVKFADENGKEEYVWATSWGVSTRLMGALVLTHSDDDGLVLPPKLAPTQLVIVPIPKGDESKARIQEEARRIQKELEAKGVRVKFDDDDTKKPGWKFSEHEFKGVPLRMAIGPKDLENGTVELARRDTKEKEFVDTGRCVQRVEELLEELQKNLYVRAKDFLERNTHTLDDLDRFREVMEDGGFVWAHWDGTPETEDAIKEATKATIRCIPLDQEKEEGNCIWTGKPSSGRVLFARAY